MKSTENNNETI